MQEQEKQEQPNEQESAKLVDPTGNVPDTEYVPAKPFEKKKVEGENEYFWAGSVYTMTNLRRETIYGVVSAQSAHAALERVTSHYSAEKLYRHFELATLNKV